MGGRVPVVGVVGAGQLARMTWQAAISLGVPIRLLAASPGEAAARVAPRALVGRPDDPDALAALAQGSDVVTFDHELVDGALLSRLEAAGHRLAPSAATLAVVTDKRRQRRWMAKAGLPVPAFAEPGGVDDLRAFGETHGWPVVVKAARGGYDGRGVWVAADAGEAAAAWEELAGRGLPALVEAHVPIQREVAVLVARRPGGEAVAYPVVETVQVDGQCNELGVPAPVAPPVAAAAVDLARRAAQGVGAVGILAVELFVTGEGVVVNELAARPHNSGHWTIEGAVTSQFENHLRAVCDLPLGATDATAPAVATVNVLGTAATGDPRERLGAALADPGVHVHLYEKEPRPGRKLGHVTVTGRDRADVAARARRAAGVLAGESG